MSEKLLPCPFCGVGTDNELGPCPNYGIRKVRGEQWFVTCGCATGVQTADFNTVEEAIAAWNRRASSHDSAVPIPGGADTERSGE